MGFGTRVILRAKKLAERDGHDWWRLSPVLLDNYLRAARLMVARETREETT